VKIGKCQGKKAKERRRLTLSHWSLPFAQGLCASGVFTKRGEEVKKKNEEE